MYALYRVLSRWKFCHFLEQTATEPFLRILDWGACSGRGAVGAEFKRDILSYTQFVTKS